MALANVNLTDTFDTWRTRTNQIIIGLDQNDIITTAAFVKANIANSNFTGANILSRLLTVDGSSSGLDADLLDGQHGSYYLANTTNITFAGNLNYTGNVNVYAILTHANGNIGSANSVLFSDGKKNYWFPMLKIYDVDSNQVYP